MQTDTPPKKVVLCSLIGCAVVCLLGMLTGCTTPTKIPDDPNDPWQQAIANVLKSMGLVFLSLCMVCCAPFAKVSPDGTVLISQGVLSKVDGSAVTVTKPDGTSIKMVTKGFNGTEVANTALVTLPTVAGISAGVKKAVSADNVKINAANNATKQQGQAIAGQVQQSALKAGNVDTAVKAGAPVTPITITQ